MLSQKRYTDFIGANYIPTNAYNAYQQWRDYSPDIAERDLGYARKINVTAIRMWLSYEFWKDDPNEFEKRFESFLKIADEKGILVLPSLFECCGTEPTRENIENTDQLTGSPIRSPGSEIEKDETRWKEPFQFLDWFLDSYRNDSRLLAIEIINEPLFEEDHLFALGALRHARKKKGSVPFTLGAQAPLDNSMYTELLDILQIHENFVMAPNWMRFLLKKLKTNEKILGKPIWVTEWQRIRVCEAGGFTEEMLRNRTLNPNTPETEKVFSKLNVSRKDLVYPSHAELAQLLRECNVCNFVWSLMLKPAYVNLPRLSGTFSGIFHEDGSVYSLEDARAVSGNSELVLPENPTFPKQFDRIAKISEE